MVICTEGKWSINFFFVFYYLSMWENLTLLLFCRYVVLGKGPVFEKDKFLGTRPVWFIYTGVGCQWPTMGRDLLKFDTFKDSFNRCAEALKPYGIDLYDIVTSDDPTVLEDIRHSFTAICAVQVALTDVLKSLGIAPDGIAGYSMGEIGKQKTKDVCR